MEELLGKGKSSNCSQESTGEEVESHEEKVDKEIYQLCSSVHLPTVQQSKITDGTALAGLGKERLRKRMGR